MATTTKARPAPVPKRKPVRRGSSRPAGLLTWVTVGLIAVVILVIVLVKVTSSPATVSGVYVPTSPAIAAEVTSVPASVFNAVGTNSPDVPVSPPTSFSDLPPMNWKLNGVAKPSVYYYGGEFCPYCAAARWPLIIALSRFGTFTGLGNMQSSATDTDPNTQTFTLWKATYTSPYFNFFHTEADSNVPSPAGGWEVLQTPTTVENTEVQTYDSPSYFPGLQNVGDIPFISFDNRFIILGQVYPPDILANLSRSTIAGLLTDPNELVTRGIIATANEITASVCAIDGQKPSTVCQSAGVKAADTTMKIKT